MKNHGQIYGWGFVLRLGPGHTAEREMLKLTLMTWFLTLPHCKGNKHKPQWRWSLSCDLPGKLAQTWNTFKHKPDIFAVQVVEVQRDGCLVWHTENIMQVLFVTTEQQWSQKPWRSPHKINFQMQCTVQCFWLDSYTVHLTPNMSLMADGSIKLMHSPEVHNYRSLC